MIRSAETMLRYQQEEGVSIKAMPPSLPYGPRPSAIALAPINNINVSVSAHSGIVQRRSNVRYSVNAQLAMTRSLLSLNYSKTESLLSLFTRSDVQRAVQRVEGGELRSITGLMDWYVLYILHSMMTPLAPTVSDENVHSPNGGVIILLFLVAICAFCIYKFSVI